MADGHKKRSNGFLFTLVLFVLALILGWIGCAMMPTILEMLVEM